MTKNFDFIDDLPTANAHIAEHEARLGLSGSAPRIDILAANTVLSGLRLMETPMRATVPATQSTATTPSPRLGASASVLARPDHDVTADNGKFPELRGASRLAAAYKARQAIHPTR